MVHTAIVTLYVYNNCTFVVALEQTNDSRIVLIHVRLREQQMMPRLTENK